MCLGKKLYTKENISKAETEWLGIPELVVLKTNRDDVGLEVVHRRYFEDEKLLCPACRSSRTRCSKIVDRKLKDLLWLDEDHKTFQIISLLFISVICAVIIAGKAFSLSLQNLEKRDANSQIGYQMPWQMEPFNSHIKSMPALRCSSFYCFSG